MHWLKVDWRTDRQKLMIAIPHRPKGQRGKHQRKINIILFELSVIYKLNVDEYPSTQSWDI